MLGIAVLSYNRFAGAVACLESIRQFTTTPHQLILADDGSSDGIQEYALARGIDVVGRSNRGVAWNYNRALWTLKDCDPIILFESDTWPVYRGWELPWIEAAERFGQINWAYECSHPNAGSGTPEDPWLCERFGSQCVVTSWAALQLVGYHDPRFYEWKYSIAHAEWTFRMSRAMGWKRATDNDTPPCLRHGVSAVQIGSCYSGARLEESCQLLKEIVDQPPYREPWRDGNEQADFLADVAVQPGRRKITHLVGNSHQLSLLTDAERAHLDSAQFVVVCNEFPSHWRKAGFRPTHWIFGDTECDHGCGILEHQLTAIRTDATLRQRLRHLFVSCHDSRAVNIVAASGLPVTLYRRGQWNDPNQVFAKSLYDPLFHRTTGLDMLNLSLILNPGAEIRVLGCQRGMRTGHFYDGINLDSDPAACNEIPLWEAFQAMKRSGVNIIDCNAEHTPAILDLYGIPRSSLI